MAFRFRKSVKIAPGVRMNIGKRGPSSLSVGKTNFGKRGVHQNFNIPGTGISYRSKVFGRSQSGSRANVKQPRARASKTTQRMPIQILLQSDGSVVFNDEKGRPLPDNLVREAKKQNRDYILQWLHEMCDKFNAEIDTLLNIHLTTPAPVGEVFVNPKPAPPEMQKSGCLGRLFSSYQKKIEERNQQAQKDYENAIVDWEKSEHALRTDTVVMEGVLLEALGSIEWPRETLVSFEIVDNGETVLLDVDLPEIEDMPTQEAHVNSRGLHLKLKDRSQTQLRLDYVTHIHAIGFRFIGDVFAYLPSVSTVVFSGYSQRLNDKTGHIEDEYLYSVRVDRARWEEINFDNLEAVDVVAAFEQFDLRRKSTKRGVLSPVEPFAT
jgi:hypothetical protein